MYLSVLQQEGCESKGFSPIQRAEDNSCNRLVVPHLDTDISRVKLNSCDNDLRS